MEDFIFGNLTLTDEIVAKLTRQMRGVYHGHRMEPTPAAPDQPVALFATTGPAVAADAAYLYYTTDGSEPQGVAGQASHGHVLPMQRVETEWVSLLWDYVVWWKAELPPLPAGTRVRYKIEARDSIGGTSAFADNGAADSQTATRFSFPVSDAEPPAWAREAIIYHVFVDRFNPGAGRKFANPGDLRGFYGGTLRGVAEKLDYIASLGATAIWLSPIFASPSHHGYDATDLYAIEPRLGTADDFRALVEAAHARGIRIILDFVPNHVSNRHPYFVSAQTDPHSPYRQWFTFRRWPDEYESFFGVKSLPQWNNEHPPARAYMLDVARYWMQEFGVDGYRLDYANGPSHDFWTDFRFAVKAANPDAFIFGEIVESGALLRTYQGRLDGSLDFLLTHNLRRAFAFGTMTLAELSTFVDRHAAYFDPRFIRPSFLDNHDMNRFLWLVKGDKRKLRLAALCQYTLAGPPIVYYGTEVGLSQERDCRTPDGHGRPHEARAPMLWGDAQDADLLAYYRTLGRMRRERPALWRGEHTTLAVDNPPGTWAYARTDGEDCVIAILNAGDSSAEVSVPVAGLGLADGTRLRNLLGEEVYAVAGGRLRVGLAAMSGVALAI
ncbi:MAG: glycoside hydrolase family 13 protein [Anaerolineae bacterium]|nr:glycoside hydrolase family 13 protein [Anaerolineae bacterium]